MTRDWIDTGTGPGWSPDADLDEARAELDTAWEVTCRYGCCTVFVSPDSNVREDLGGWGPVGCPCEGGGE